MDDVVDTVVVVAVVLPVVDPPVEPPVVVTVYPLPVVAVASTFLTHLCLQCLSPVVDSSQG